MNYVWGREERLQEFFSNFFTWLQAFKSFHKKTLTLDECFCGAYETRTRDPLRDRQIF